VGMRPAGGSSSGVAQEPRHSWATAAACPARSGVGSKGNTPCGPVPGASRGRVAQKPPSHRRTRRTALPSGSGLLGEAPTPFPIVAWDATQLVLGSAPRLRDKGSIGLVQVPGAYSLRTQTFRSTSPLGAARPAFPGLTGVEPVPGAALALAGQPAHPEPHRTAPTQHGPRPPLGSARAARPRRLGQAAPQARWRSSPGRQRGAQSRPRPRAARRGRSVPSARGGSRSTS
jgi:hypothetical protein